MPLTINGTHIENNEVQIITDTNGDLAIEHKPTGQTIGLDENGTLSVDAVSSDQVQNTIYANNFNTSQEAVDAASDGDVVYFPAGDGPYSPFIAPPKNVKLKSDGARIDAGVGEHGIDSPSRHPDAPPFYGDSSPASAISRGDETISVDNASIFSEGELVWIQDLEDSYLTLDGPSPAEFAFVESVDTSANTITVQSPVSLNYTNPTGALRVVQLNFASERLVIEGFDLHGAGSTDSNETSGIEIRQCKRVRIRDCSTQDFTRNGVRLVHIYDGLITGCSSEDIRSDHNTTEYGFAIYTSKNIRISDCFARNMRHGIESSPLGTGTPAQNLVVSNCTVEGTREAAYDVHAGAENVIYSGCNSLNCGGAYTLRGVQCMVNGGTHRGLTGAGIATYEVPEKIVVRDVTLEGEVPSPAIRLTAFDGHTIDEVDISGVNIENDGIGFDADNGSFTIDTLSLRNSTFRSNSTSYSVIGIDTGEGVDFNYFEMKGCLVEGGYRSVEIGNTSVSNTGVFVDNTFRNPDNTWLKWWDNPTVRGNEVIDASSLFGDAANSEHYGQNVFRGTSAVDLAEDKGQAQAQDGSTISHDLVRAPTYAEAHATTANHTAVVTGTSGTGITISVTDGDGNAVTTNQTIYWSASI